ncbi:hypothetical protein DICPUDRAFT_89281 [Dictyostelium purpureum]|uniref:ENTH domain-containing protein n=1 Tax=Dictyostelium purpureum TaxID=5786 RepID=F0ZUT1_DICPU|nr:uncharacterized protein DICPUDRAFT_89281 [Dictyostelium purpureum]EGC32295.1 hypothetical protein DICPUDRAFT_89281 [Dictyostelium purpureum]|eukprot:XP_003291173.1 hypothetical protein DICPUDRAFT_89281 [Dictyostelium purpureum]
MNNIIVNISNNVNSILSIVGKATLDSSEPTSGYLLLELQNETFKSIEKCEDILKKLLERLKKESSHVKLKSLKCIKHLMLKGNPVFKQELLLNSNEIYKCTSYNGKQDAIYGDNPYMLVRKEAQDILNMLYQYSNNDNNSGNNSNNSYNNNELALYEGYGNSIVVVPQQQRVMVGVGSSGAITNAPVQQLTPMDEIKQDIKQKIQSLPSKVFNTEQSKLSFESVPNTDPNQFSLVPLRDGTHFIDNSNNNNNNNSFSDTDPNNPYLGTDEYINITGYIGNETSSNLSTSSISKFFSYYKQLSSESTENVLSILYYSIESSKKWQTKQKYLCLIEFLIVQKIETAIQFYKSNNTHLINISNSIHLGPREKSKSILRLLGIDFEKDLQSIQEQQKKQKELLEKQYQNNNSNNNNSNNSSNNSNNNSNNQTGSIFNFDTDQSPVTSPNQNLFGGLNVKNNMGNKSNNNFNNSSNNNLIGDLDFLEIKSDNKNNNMNNNMNNMNNMNNNNNNKNNNINNNMNNNNNNINNNMNNNNNINNNINNNNKNININNTSNNSLPKTVSNSFDTLDPIYSNNNNNKSSSIMDDFDFSSLSFSNTTPSSNTLKPLSQSTPATPIIVPNSSVNSSPLLKSSNNGLNDFDFFATAPNTNNCNNNNNNNNNNNIKNNIKTNSNNTKVNSDSPFGILDSYITTQK